MKKILKYFGDFYKILSFSAQLSIKGSFKYFILIILFNLLSIGMPFIMIYFGSIIIELIAGEVVKGNISNVIFDKFIFISLLSLIIVFVNKFIEKTNLYFNGMHREIMHKHIKYIVMEKTANLDLNYFDSYSFYNELSDSANNSALVINTIFQSISFIRYFIQFIIAFIYLMNYSIVFSFLLLFSSIPSVIFQNRQMEAMYSFQREHLSEERKMYYTSNLLFSRQNIKDVKLFNLFPFISEKFNAAWNMLFSKKRKLSFKYTVYLTITSFFPEIITAIIHFSLGWSVLSGEYNIGNYIYYQGIVGQVLAGIYLIIYNYGQMMDGKIRILNFLEFMKWENNVKDNGLIELDGNISKIEFASVSFKYNENSPYILKDLNFTIQMPQKIALVGVNGCGKTTLIKLIMRYYDPTEGSILVNGIDIKKYTIESLQKCFSTMFQDYSNYAFNVKDSVSISNYLLSDQTEKINSAIDASGANTFVSKFPNGINTYLTRQYEQDGEELSGGQWQKIAMARTIFREASLYILDEPSASLDAESEDELFKQFDILYKDKGAILVSHRLSNITSVDKIIVLNQGVIEEIGTHAELIEKNGKYAYLYMLQAKKYSM